MTEYDIKRLALVLAVQAEIEGMKIWNLNEPDRMGFSKIDFNNKAEELRELVNKHDHQL
jgi:hypothetical protein